MSLLFFPRLCGHSASTSRRLLYALPGRVVPHSRPTHASIAVRTPARYQTSWPCGAAHLVITVKTRSWHFHLLTQLGTMAIIVYDGHDPFAVWLSRARDLAPYAPYHGRAIVGGVAMTAVATYAATVRLMIGNPESPWRWILPA